MRRDEIMKSDIVTEIVLLSAGVAILVSFLMVLAVALTGTAAA